MSLQSVIRENWRAVMLPAPSARRAWALSGGAGLACCWQQQSRQDWKGGGGRCRHGGLAQLAGSLRALSPGTCCSLSASLTCPSRRGIGLVSLLPRPSWGFLSECIWAVLATQTRLERKCFSWTFYTEAVWRWVTSSSVGVWACTL